MEVLRKYGASATIYFPLIDAGAQDFEATPVTFASGDTKIIKDGGAATNTTNDPAHEGVGIYSLVLTGTEMECAIGVVTLVDTAAKEWEDQAILIATHGNASAQYAIDLDTVMRGTDSAALASVCTEGRLDELDAGNLPADVDTIKAAATEARLAELDAANLPADVDTIKAAATEARLAELDAANLPADVDSLISGVTLVLADTGTIITDTTLILADTGEIGTAGAGLTDLGGMSTGMKAEVNAECDTANTDYGTTVMTEAYAADGATATPEQLAYMIWATLSQFAISGTTMSVKKLDGGTEAMAMTLDDDTNPTSRTRSS